jgi:hypothetical protein
MRTPLHAALFFVLATGCVHATMTRTEEERGEKSGEKKQGGVGKKRTPARAETMETSATTRQMFKPGGIARLQAALDDAVRELDDPQASEGQKHQGHPALELEPRDRSRASKTQDEEEEQRVEADAQAKKVTVVKETGRFDSPTQLALLRYQKSAGLPATGLPDYETLRRLGLDPREILFHDVPAERHGVQ